MHTTAMHWTHVPQSCAPSRKRAISDVDMDDNQADSSMCFTGPGPSSASSAERKRVHVAPQCTPTPLHSPTLDPAEPTNGVTPMSLAYLDSCLSTDRVQALRANVPCTRSSTSTGQQPAAGAPVNTPAATPSPQFNPPPTQRSGFSLPELGPQFGAVQCPFPPLDQAEAACQMETQSSVTASSWRPTTVGSTNHDFSTISMDLDHDPTQDPVPPPAPVSSPVLGRTHDLAPHLFITPQPNFPSTVYGSNINCNPLETTLLSTVNCSTPTSRAQPSGR